MDLKVEVTYKRIKNMNLRVRDGIVKVSAPFNIDSNLIKKFVNNNLDYIKKQLVLQENKKEEKIIRINDNVTIFNNTYQVLPITSKCKVTAHYIFVKENDDIRKQIKKLFKNELLNYLTMLTYKFYSLMSLQCPMPKIIIKDVKSKWGSYNKSKHEIVYASELLFKDEDVINYLIVHELAHIVEFNHSANFYKLVSKYCPDYKKLRDKLKRS